MAQTSVIVIMMLVLMKDITWVEMIRLCKKKTTAWPPFYFVLTNLIKLRFF